jgi:small subunit ribosomal protein S7
MSLISLRSCRTTLRTLALPVRWNSTQAQTERPSGPARTEQRALQNIGDIIGQPFDKAPSAPLPAVDYSASLSDTSFLQAATRPGYTADNLPPKVDPTLELFTHLIMKHGRKAEAQKVVADVLQQL